MLAPRKLGRRRKRGAMAETRGFEPVPIAAILAGLSRAEPPRLVLLRRAAAGIGSSPGTLLCLSASFNPLTRAHAALIEQATRLFPPRETLLLLATVNVDKAVTGLPLDCRLDLLLRYANPRPGVSVGVVAYGRFADKLEAIRAAYPADTRVLFLLGFDTLVRLFDGKYYADREASLRRLFDGSEYVVANRDADPRAVETFLARPEVAPFAPRIHVVRLAADLASVSATEVRTLLSRGESVADLVPPEILAALMDAWRGLRPQP